LIHNPELLDSLSAYPTETFRGSVFRATRLRLDPLAASTSGGRWSPRDQAPVLYTSLEFEGALAEISFHWSRFTPLPSKPVVMHRIQVSTDRTLRLRRCDLAELGVDMGQFGALDYTKCQEIGAAVGFLECDGLIVPSTRWECENLVLFTDNHSLLSDLNVVESTEFAWQDWARKNGFID
jgi:RES domain-containing protein